MDKKLFLVLVAVAALAVNVDAKTGKKQKAPFGAEEGDPFTDTEHFPDGKHNPQYDQKAFLGEEQADAMHGLSKEEMNEKLKMLFPKIDVNSDGKVSRKELSEWMVENVKKHVAKNTKERMAEIDANKDGKVTWDEYHKYQEQFPAAVENGGLPLAEQMKHEKKKFEAADSNGDNELNADEMGLFLHPEESPRMTSIVLEENMQIMDKNRDGLISMDEYSGLVGNEAKKVDKETADSLRESFNELDKNKDGMMDRDEVKEWIFPGGDDNPAAGEADHLLKEADTDKDNYLSLKEIQENPELFSGGRATAYGDLLKNDEL